MLDKLGNALKKATDKISNAIFLDKNLIDNIVRDLQRALIEADVPILLVKQISQKLKKTAFDENIKGLEKKEQLLKALHDELISILGEKKELTLNENAQTRIMLCGLYAAGKTTTSAKLANYFQKRGKKVALIGLDVHRPAAKEQLRQLGQEHNLSVYTLQDNSSAISNWEEIEPKLSKYDLVIIDTAGRHDLDQELTEEIELLKNKIKPNETILVMQADIGQAAKNQAEKFSSILNITGVIITRMDSTAKGGGAIAACKETNSGIYFIANGEKINDIEKFNPESFLSRLLGMGDLESLIEKIRSITDEDKQKNLAKKLTEGKLSLTDVVEQIKSMNSLGGFDKLMSMIPGMGKAKIDKSQLEKQQEKIAKWEHLVNSMTPEERQNPETIKKQTTRISRIAKGAGVNNSDLRSLLKQYDMLNSMMKGTQGIDMENGMNEKQIQKLMKKFARQNKKMRF